MNFTREPIIETIISSRDGCKLVVRNSKATGQEEYFVDALEVVSFGGAFFFRSLERPKSFLVPVTDYEVLEVKETRVMLKHVAVDRSIKIAGGRDATLKTGREPAPQIEKKPIQVEPEESSQEESGSRSDRKRDRRRYRRRRGRGSSEDANAEDDEAEEINVAQEESREEMQKEPEQPRGRGRRQRGESSRSEQTERTSGEAPSYKGVLLPPPPTLISDTIAQYKDQYGIKDEKPSEKIEEEFSAVSIDEVSSEAVTEIVASGDDHYAVDGAPVTAEEFLGEKTGEGSLEVFPHPEDDTHDKGPAFPSMWFPFSAHEVDEEEENSEEVESSERDQLGFETQSDDSSVEESVEDDREVLRTPQDFDPQS